MTCSIMGYTIPCHLSIQIVKNYFSMPADSDKEFIIVASVNSACRSIVLFL